MTHRTGFLLTWLMLVLGVSVVGLGQAGEGFTTSVYEGQIKAVKIVKCGMQPGLCEGSIILAQQGSEDTQVDIRIGTWIKRGANFLTIEDLQIGDQVKTQTFRLPGEANLRAAILEFSPTITPLHCLWRVILRPKGAFSPRLFWPSPPLCRRERAPPLRPTTFMGCVA